MTRCGWIESEESGWKMFCSLRIGQVMFVGDCGWKLVALCTLYAVASLKVKKRGVFVVELVSVDVVLLFTG